MSHDSRSYYSTAIHTFLGQSTEEIIGFLSIRNEFALDLPQRNAWQEEISVLKQSLTRLRGHLFLEYSIPRMGKRADAIVLLSNVIVVIEFKIGESRYAPHAIDQVFDYALDLKNFHKESHDKSIVPVLVATEAAPCEYRPQKYSDNLLRPILANRRNLGDILSKIMRMSSGSRIDPVGWMNSIYCPTPTIIEAAQSLYRGHSVKEMSRSEAGATNLTKTANTIWQIVKESKSEAQKAICFVTGVPGAGKTLAGLNIANSWHSSRDPLHAVFLSGNGPLVAVLREALARDDVTRASRAGEKLTKSDALRKVRAFIQNIHHFRDDGLETDQPPVNRVVIFDEAQRAWDLHKTAAFMKAKKGIPNFTQSEPDFLISYMDRFSDWATVICLIGGGQEINTGEAGLTEWFHVLRRSYPDWVVYVSPQMWDSGDKNVSHAGAFCSSSSVVTVPELHLATSIRSFRSEHVSAFVSALLNCEQREAVNILQEMDSSFPIVLTRDLDTAKQWLREKARGTERYGIIASSEARRLRPFGIDVKNEIDPCKWFLNDKADVRSSFSLEDVATEFQIQGQSNWIGFVLDGMPT